MAATRELLLDVLTNLYGVGVVKLSGSSVISGSVCTNWWLLRSLSPTLKMLLLQSEWVAWAVISSVWASQS